MCDLEKKILKNEKAMTRIGSQRPKIEKKLASVRILRQPVAGL